MSLAPDLYLASKSPRRSQLLAEAGIRFELCEPGQEYEGRGHEHQSEVGDPRRLCRLRAERKARGAALARPVAPVLAVDTVVDVGGVELGKAADRGAARAMLRRLLGRTHEVHTAHCVVWRDVERTEVVSATVRGDAVDDAAIERYLDTDEWRGKAGAYGIQDRAQSFLHLQAGAFDGVMGLHVATVRSLLARVAGERRA